MMGVWLIGAHHLAYLRVTLLSPKTVALTRLTGLARPAMAIGQSHSTASAHDGGLCKKSKSVVVSTSAVLGRLFERCNVEKESYKSKCVVLVAWTQLRGSAGSRDFHIRSKGQFKRRQQAFIKCTHPLSISTNLILQSALSIAVRRVGPPCPRKH